MSSFSVTGEKSGVTLSAVWALCCTSQAVIIKVEEIAAKNKKRFYLNEEDIISLDDTKIAVSREWNKGNIQNFINKAGRLGFAIKISVA